MKYETPIERATRWIDTADDEPTVTDLDDSGCYPREIEELPHGQQPITRADLHRGEDEAYERWRDEQP